MQLIGGVFPSHIGQEFFHLDAGVFQCTQKVRKSVSDSNVGVSLVVSDVKRDIGTFDIGQIGKPGLGGVDKCHGSSAMNWGGQRIEWVGSPFTVGGQQGLGEGFGIQAVFS